jgi:hypothetical protein
MFYKLKLWLKVCKKVVKVLIAEVLVFWIVVNQDNLYNIKTQVLFDPSNYVIEVLVAFKKETPWRWSQDRNIRRDIYIYKKLQ